MVLLGTREIRITTALAMAVGGFLSLPWTRVFFTKIVNIGVKDIPLISIGTGVAAILFWSGWQVYKGRI